MHEVGGQKAEGQKGWGRGSGIKNQERGVLIDFLFKAVLQGKLKGAQHYKTVKSRVSIILVV